MCPQLYMGLEIWLKTEVYTVGSVWLRKASITLASPPFSIPRPQVKTCFLRPDSSGVLQTSSRTEESLPCLTMGRRNRLLV